jgi:hypothetical protein
MEGPEGGIAAIAPGASVLVRPAVTAGPPAVASIGPMIPATALPPTATTLAPSAVLRPPPPPPMLQGARPRLAAQQAAAAVAAAAAESSGEEEEDGEEGSDDESSAKASRKRRTDNKAAQEKLAYQARARARREQGGSQPADALMLLPGPPLARTALGPWGGRSGVAGGGARVSQFCPSG